MSKAKYVKKPEAPGVQRSSVEHREEGGGLEGESGRDLGVLVEKGEPGGEEGEPEASPSRGILRSRRHQETEEVMLVTIFLCVALSFSLAPS